MVVHLQSNSDGNLREEESGEDTGDDINTVVVQDHLASDRNDSLACHLHDPPSLHVLPRELETENNCEEKTSGQQ